MNRPQNDFLPVTQDYMAGLTPQQALAHLRQQPDPQPLPPGMPDLPDTGPISPTLRAAAWRAGHRAATEAGFTLPPDAITHGEYSQPPYVIARLEPVDAPPIAPGQAQGHVNPPAGVPDAYRATGHYHTPESIVDQITGTSREERLRARIDGRRVRVEPDAGRMWQGQASDPTDPVEAADRQAQEDWRAVWYVGRLMLAAAGLVGFVVAGGWMLAQVFK